MSHGKIHENNRQYDGADKTLCRIFAFRLLVCHLPVFHYLGRITGAGNRLTDFFCAYRIFLIGNIHLACKQTDVDIVDSVKGTYATLYRSRAGGA